MLESSATILSLFGIMFTYMFIRINNMSKKQLEGTYRVNILVSAVELIVIALLCYLASYIMIDYTFDIEFILVSGTIGFFLTFLLFNKLVVERLGVVSVIGITIIYVLGYVGMAQLWSGGSV